MNIMEMVSINKLFWDQDKINKLDFYKENPNPKTLYIVGDEDGDIQLLWDLSDDIQPPIETIFERYDCIQLKDWDGTEQTYINFDLTSVKEVMDTFDLENWIKDDMLDIFIEDGNLVYTYNYNPEFIPLSVRYTTDVMIGSFKDENNTFYKFVKCGVNFYNKIY